ncbi:hypothetical protein LCGC14_1982070 [marine sediment metagenome]|uniref:Uncharacterized protein n=1 Tax=marine sediment metagenome TaxID=412755 RepID=A0A0F9F8I5_9ZZZZ
MARKLEFYEECASQWYDRLDPVDRKTMRELTGDLKDKPHQFIDIHTKKEYEMRSETLNASVPAESLYTLDNYIARTFYDATPSVEMLAPVTTVKTTKSHESKTYAQTDLGTAKLVGAHGSWSNPPAIGVGVSPTFIKALGVHAHYLLNFGEIDEAGLYDIEWFHALKCGEKVGTLHDQKLCMGEEAEDAEVNTTLLKGFHNYGGLQTAFLGIGDNSIVVSGELYRGFMQFLTAMKSVKEPGDNIFISTAGVHAEALILKDALGISDFDNIKKAFFDTGYIKEWWINDNIDPTETMLVTTQRAQLLKRGINTIKREIVYPLQSKLMTKEFPDDVKTMIMIMDIYKMYNANAGVICSGDCITSTLGFADNGRVL